MVHSVAYVDLDDSIVIGARETYRNYQLIHPACTVRRETGGGYVGRGGYAETRTVQDRENGMSRESERDEQT